MDFRKKNYIYLKILLSCKFGIYGVGLMDFFELYKAADRKIISVNNFSIPVMLQHMKFNFRFLSFWNILFEPSASMSSELPKHIPGTKCSSHILASLLS